MSAALRFDDAALVQRMRERPDDRESAFAELFAAYRARVFTICRHLVRSRADAEDATQEVFVALWRALPAFRGDAALSTFIHRIAVRTAIKHRERTIRHATLPPGPPPAAATDPIELRQDQARLLAALDVLSLEHRTVLALFAVEELGHRDIAAILGVPEGTVWSRLHAARKRLAALLSETPAAKP